MEHTSSGSGRGIPSAESVVQQSHTPGPWHVMAEGFARRGPWAAPTVYATDDELRYVAVCACADHMNFYSATDNLANARLIAAAPELLQACKDALLRIDGLSETDDCPVRSELRAAIKKATTPMTSESLSAPAGRVDK